MGNKDIEKYLCTLEILESHIYIQGRMGIERRPKETLSSCLWLISRLKPKVKARTESWKVWLSTERVPQNWAQYTKTEWHILIVPLSNFICWSPNPKYLKCDLILKQGHYRCNKLRFFRWAQIQYDWHPYAEGMFGTQWQRERPGVISHEDGGKPRNAKDSQKIRSWTKGMEQTFFNNFQKEQPCHHLDLGLLASRTVKQYISVA